MALTKKTKINRLLQLADLLDRVPQRKFDMAVFCADLPDDMDPAREDDCGTRACALGWATTLPFARKLGARVGDNIFPGSVSTHKSRHVREAAEELFDVDGEEWWELFIGGPGEPKAKAAQIRALCKRLQERA